jgi:hypothetical protein
MNKKILKTLQLAEESSYDLFLTEEGLILEYNQGGESLFRHKLSKRMQKRYQKYGFELYNDKGIPKPRIGKFVYNAEKDVWEIIEGILKFLLEFLPFLKNAFK